MCVLADTGHEGLAASGEILRVRSSDRQPPWTLSEGGLTFWVKCERSASGPGTGWERRAAVSVGRGQADLLPESPLGGL